MIWHEEVLDLNGKAAAACLARAVGPEFVLAGGTGLALRLGHRVSLDLDLFSSANPLGAAQRGAIIAALKSSTRLKIRESKDGACHLILEGTAVSLLHYPYPWLKPAAPWKGLPVASLEDISAMKLNAAVGRGSKKDFVDLYWLSMHLGLKNILSCAEKKFRDHSDFILQAGRALVCFEDAEKEPMPRLIKSLSWDRVKSYFEREVPRILRTRLGR